MPEIGRHDGLPEEPLSWLNRIEASIARSRKVKGGNYVQIATVDGEGLPHCRTVVFRGFLTYTEGDTANLAMKMITDSRSDKVQQIGACEVSLCV
jgi:pyridoxamine 5'-phosphate oxidase